jgi:hypothetical protein
MSATTRPMAANCAVMTATVCQRVDRVLNGTDIVGSARWVIVFPRRVGRDQPTPLRMAAVGTRSNTALEKIRQVSAARGAQPRRGLADEAPLAELVFGKCSTPLCVADTGIGIGYPARSTSRVLFGRVGESPRVASAVSEWITEQQR